MRERSSVCKTVKEKERESVRLWGRERQSERERVCVRESESERERERVCVCLWEREGEFRLHYFGEAGFVADILPSCFLWTGYDILPSLTTPTGLPRLSEPPPS